MVNRIKRFEQGETAPLPVDDIVPTDTQIRCEKCGMNVLIDVDKCPECGQKLIVPDGAEKEGK